ncbi:MAG: hypothetical protein LBD06_07820 [Candidatus Accumulibacter sp.]|nr:hypothetical protein [Accumulibacter sp.]
MNGTGKGRAPLPGWFHEQEIRHSREQKTENGRQKTDRLRRKAPEKEQRKTERSVSLSSQVSVFRNCPLISLPCSMPPRC